MPSSSIGHTRALKHEESRMYASHPFLELKAPVAPFRLPLPLFPCAFSDFPFLYSHPIFRFPSPFFQIMQKGNRKYYSRLTLDFHPDVRLCDQAAPPVLTSKPLRLKFATFVSRVIKSIRISSNPQEEQTQGRSRFHPQVCASHLGCQTREKPSRSTQRRTHT